MEEFIKPIMSDMVNYVKNHHKSVGLRMIYRKYHVPNTLKERFRRLWDDIKSEVSDAGKKQKTEENDGDSKGVAEQTVCPEPAGAVNEQGPTERVCSNT